MTTDDKPQDTGASASAETGSREPGLAARPGPSGFDPARLETLFERSTDEDLTDGGRYFADSLWDLTKCGHGDTGEYQHPSDGELVEFLWNNRHAIPATAPLS
jgi:hypothetical protein